MVLLLLFMYLCKKHLNYTHITRNEKKTDKIEEVNPVKSLGNIFLTCRKVC